ncbi:molybdate ABC transporter substrate-binding protein [Lolliginicoccus suaedae]|uniref:molybdate ABC transporter substrate-binding protein n=1 Tax=Lolliginicoccus suaedae TaxID=2605429 RepID=UPI0011EC4DE1|nr:molybdate ABC transporter substrate-binding protein [Lolliginicoccus suaedae]
MSGCADQARPEAGDTITVFAAASLHASFTEIAEIFEARNPGVDVELSFAGSSDLAAQLIAGAPADVFAAASKANMQKVVDAGLIAGEPVVFAANVLTIITAPGNREGISSLADLTDPSLLVVTCAPQVPCGAAAQAAASQAGVTLKPVSEESSVSGVLAKVTSGQADAGLVYVTDARAAGDEVTAVAFPEAAAAVNTYPVALLGLAKENQAAHDFVDLLIGEDGQRVMAEAGFRVP